MTKFFNSFTFILSFMILTFVIQITLGEKFAKNFLMLVLFGMILLNGDQFIAMVNNAFTVQKI